MAWADYLHTGRSDLLDAYYDLLQRKALLDLAREDGLISTETGLVTPELLAGIHLEHPHPLRDLVDWPPGSFAQGGVGERDGYDMTPIKTVVNAFHVWNLNLLGLIADTLGKTADAERFRQRYRKVLQSLHRVCFQEGRGFFVDGEGSCHASLHANMLPAALGLVPAGIEASVMKHIRSRGMACSVYGAQYLLEACYRLGDADYALDLMTAGHDRGWLNMLRVGSTITMEAWDLRYKNNLDWNHAWGAAPANIIPRFIVGVQPAKPGFEEVLVAPQPGRLQTVEAKVPTPNGPVFVRIEPDVAAGRRVQIDSPAPVRLDRSGLSCHGLADTSTVALKAGRHVIIV
jgi:alpha-L-rhamnosidase